MMRIQDNEYTDEIPEKYKNVLEISTRVGSMDSGLISKHRDDRTRRIEIIRRTESRPINLDLNDVQKRSVQIFREKNKKRNSKSIV